MHALIVIAVVWAYLQIGFLLGKVSHRVWFANEPNPLLAFLLFPINAYVEESWSSRDIDGAAISGFWGASKDGNDGKYFEYRMIVFFLWPVKIAWNFVIIAFLWPDHLYQAVKAWRAERRAEAEKQKAEKQEEPMGARFKPPM